MTEREIQNDIRIELSDHGTYFRANVGSCWTANQVQKLPDGSIHLIDPHPFNSGLPRGFSDVFGITPITITEDDVGKTVGVFTAIEIKRPGNKPTPEQVNFLRVVTERGGLAGIAHSAEEAVQIIKQGGASVVT